MLRLTALFFIIALLLFRPFQMQKPGMLYPGDDFSYFAYATSFAFLEYPSFEKEFVEEFKVPPLSRIGAGLMAAPLVAPFSILDRLTGSKIAEKRTRENIVSSWSLFGAVLASVIYLWLSCLLLFKGLRLLFEPRIATAAVAVMVLTQGAPLYAFRRPVFSHINELFLQSALFFLFVRHAGLTGQAASRRMNWRLTALVGFLCSLVLLVRQNGIIYAAIWPAMILGFENGKPAWARWKNVVMALVGAFSVYWVLKYLPQWLAPEQYVQANAAFESSSFLFDPRPVAYYLHRIWRIFLGWDWGLFYTAPFLLLGTVALLLKRLSHRHLYWLLAAPLLVNLYILVIWNGQGGWYGYRYLVFSAIPILIVPLATLLRLLLDRNPWLFRAALGLACLPVASMLLFEGTPSTGMEAVILEGGYPSTGNLTYQLAVWKTILLTPGYFLFTVLKAGPAYLLAYVPANLLGLEHWLPAKFSEVYAYFDWNVLIKSLVLYASPWALYGLYARQKSRA